MTRTELAVTVGTAALSFFGALLGVYAGSRFEQQNWESRFELEQKRVLLEKRVAVIERVIIVLNKAPLMKGLQASLDAEHEMAKLAVFCASKDGASSKGCKSKPRANIERVETVGREVYTLNSEVAAAASLAAVYFGPNTRNEVTELQKIGFWAASDEQKGRLISAMGSEINTFSK